MESFAGQVPSAALVMTIFLSIVPLILFCLYLLRNPIRLLIYSRFTGFPFPKNLIVLDKDIPVSMPDGIKLLADIYRPKKKNKYPVILVRTPYNKSGKLHPYKQLAELFASHGYVVVVQDVRGKYASEGTFMPYLNEALDGHTTVTWAGQAPWSNGKVALFGISYLGSCAWLATRYRSPYLRTIISMFTSHNTHSLLIDDGIPQLRGPFFWLARIHKRRENKEIDEKKLMTALWKLPVNDLDLIAINRRIAFYHEYLSHISYDSFWEKRSVSDRTLNLNIPVLIIGGWYDVFLKGTLDDYQSISQLPVHSKIKESRLIIGPWAHNPTQKFKKMKFEKHASANVLLVASLKWFERWLNDKSTNEVESKVRYFIMGKNVWNESDTWPPSNTTYEKYYLSHEGLDITHQNGQLSPTPSAHLHMNRYIYDPSDPILFRGSYHLHNDWVVPVNQDEIIHRNDVLFYTSESFKQDLVIAGSIICILYIASTAIDTDFFVQICDVHPDGEAYNISLGVKRMRYRDSLDQPHMISPGKIYRVEIPIRSVAHAFLKGHRLQLHIASADFPTHERNLNTGLNCEDTTEIQVAEQTIYTGGSYESHLLLPKLE